MKKKTQRTFVHNGWGYYLLTSNTGFAISSLLYPVFILIITIVVITIIVVTQSTFSKDKLTSEISGNLSDNNTMKSLKENVESAIDESSTTGLVYNATSGIIFNTPFTSSINTSNWTGKVYTSDAGDKLAYIDNGTYCAFQLPGMSGVAVYNTGICVEKIKAYTGISDLVCNNTDTLVVNKISDSTELPKISENYVVFVVTSIDVNKYLISNDTPEAPEEGMVWFQTVSSNSSIKIKSYGLSNLIGAVKQYQNGSWVDAYAYEYYDSKWNNLFSIIKEYSYTGAYETYTIPVSGTYILEVAGAQSGKATAQGGLTYAQAVAGVHTYPGDIAARKGGYTKANFVLKVGDILKIAVGGAGGDTFYQWGKTTIIGYDAWPYEKNTGKWTGSTSYDATYKLYWTPSGYWQTNSGKGGYSEITISRNSTETGSIKAFGGTEVGGTSSSPGEATVQGTVTGGTDATYLYGDSATQTGNGFVKLALKTE